MSKIQTFIKNSKKIDNDIMLIDYRDDMYENAKNLIASKFAQKFYFLLLLVFIIFHLSCLDSNSSKIIINDAINRIYENKLKDGNVVILTSSLKPRYLFVLPFTVASWNRLNVSAIIFLIGDKLEFENNKQTQVTIKLLETMETQIIYLKSEKISPISLSQLVRIFAAALPISNLYLPNETIFITSDADLLVFHLENHIPMLSNNKTLHIYNSRCCNPVNIPPKRGNAKVRMYPIGTIGATIETWRNIMNFNRFPFTASDIENYVISQFGPKFFHFNDSNNPRLIGSSIWYADQSLVSYKLDIWLKNPFNNLSFSEHITTPRRIDRIKWPKLSNFKDMQIKDWDDCHQPTAAFETAEWSKFIPFLVFAFRDDSKLLREFEMYRNEFISNARK